MRCVLADPTGSGLYHWVREGAARVEGPNSITEGIGVTFVPGNLDGMQPDFCYQISDDEALPYVYDLIKNEGISVGGSSGINISGAVRLAEELGPGHTIVTILCDAASRYQSKLFNAEYWARPALENAKTGLAKMKAAVDKAFG